MVQASECAGESLGQACLQLTVLYALGLPGDYFTAFGLKIIPNSIFLIFSITTSLLSVLFGFNSFHLSKVCDADYIQVIKYMTIDIWYSLVNFCLIIFTAYYANLFSFEIYDRDSNNNYTHLTDNKTDHLERFDNYELAYFVVLVIFNLIFLALILLYVYILRRLRNTFRTQKSYQSNMFFYLPNLLILKENYVIEYQDLITVRENYSFMTMIFSFVYVSICFTDMSIELNFMYYKHLFSAIGLFSITLIISSIEYIYIKHKKRMLFTWIYNLDEINKTRQKHLNEENETVVVVETNDDENGTVVVVDLHDEPISENETVVGVDINGEENERVVVVHRNDDENSENEDNDSFDLSEDNHIKNNETNNYQIRLAYWQHSHQAINEPNTVENKYNLKPFSTATILSHEQPTFDAHKSEDNEYIIVEKLEINKTDMRQDNADHTTESESTQNSSYV